MRLAAPVDGFLVDSKASSRCVPGSAWQKYAQTHAFCLLQFL